MSTDVDLRQLAIDRGSTSTPTIRTRRHVLSRYVLPLVLLLGFACLVAWATWEVAFPPRQVTVVPVLWTTADVQQEGTPLFKAAGWVEPRPTSVRVAALAPGVVERLLVVEDQAVERGEAIAELVEEDAQLVLDRAVANLQLREAEQAEARAALAAATTRFEQPVHLQAALGEAEALLAQIETELKNLPFATRRADADYQSAKSVYQSKRGAQGVVAGVDIDVAKGKLDSALAQLEELRGRAASLEKQHAALVQRRNALNTQLELLAEETKARDEAEARLAAAQARVAQAHVAIKEAELQLDRMTVRSPIDGRVYRLIALPGARIGDGGTSMPGIDGSTVVTMYDPQSLQVRVDVRFEDIPKVTLDQPVEIDNPALSRPIVGTVLFVSSEADIQKNTLEVKVGVADPPSVFKPEMLVDVTFLSPKPIEPPGKPGKAAKLYLPQQLIHRSEHGQYVWLADQSTGVAKNVAVETGDVGNNGLVEIRSGLNIASRVIATGTAGLEEGMRITVTQEDSTLAANATTEQSKPRPAEPR
jgi:HlyD family secretion protein